MIPGTTRIDGAGCDDCTSPVTMPFPVNIYGTSFTAGTAGSNGVLAFGTNANAFAGSCLPVPTATNELMPFYRDQRTDCTAGCGIFTATTGSAPNRVFTVEYKTIYFGETSTTPTLDYEVNFYESGSTAFDYTYGVIAPTTQTGRITSIGVTEQRNALQAVRLRRDRPDPACGHAASVSAGPSGLAPHQPRPRASTPGITPTPSPVASLHTWSVDSSSVLPCAGRLWRLGYFQRHLGLVGRRLQLHRLRGSGCFPALRSGHQHLDDPCADA